MKRPYKIGVILLALALLLGGCKMPAPSGSSENPDALATEAILTMEAFAKGAATPANAAKTSQPPTPTPSPKATRSSISKPADNTGPRVEKAELVADVTVPDGTIFQPGVPFVKTWRLANTGNTTWTPDYSLIFVSGELMGAQDIIPLTEDVPPGEEVDISAPMKAPEKTGDYYSLWMLRNVDGSRFGLDPGASQPIYVLIKVDRDLGTPAVTATPSTKGEIITWAFLSVDNTTAQGCPHTFNFTANVTLSQPAALAYQLEAAVTDPSVIVNLPKPVILELPAGTHTLNFALNFAKSVNGWARLHMTEPENVISNQVNYTLACP